MPPSYPFESACCARRTINMLGVLPSLKGDVSPLVKEK